jgi:hypothetical protein
MTVARRIRRGKINGGNESREKMRVYAAERESFNPFPTRWGGK